MVVSETFRTKRDSRDCTMINIGKMEKALEKAGLAEEIHSVQLVPMTKGDSNQRSYFHTGIHCDKIEFENSSLNSIIIITR